MKASMVSLESLAACLCRHCVGLAEMQLRTRQASKSFVPRRVSIDPDIHVG